MDGTVLLNMKGIKLNTFHFFSIAIVLLLSDGYSLAQNPFMEEKVWRTNIRLEEAFDEIILTTVDLTLSPLYAYYRMEFISESNFRAYNIPGCGLDCVIYSYGSYKLDGNSIQLSIDSTFRYKQCHGDSILLKNLGTYFWIQDEYGMRILQDLDDEPKLDYFSKLGIKIKPFKEKEANDLIARYIYLYNRLYRAVENKDLDKINQIRTDLNVWKHRSNGYMNQTESKSQKRYLELHIELDARITELLEKGKT